MHTDSQVSVKTERIRQGLFRIKEKNNNDEFLIVPVWAFESTVYLDDERGRETYA